jgi:Family of unknown function (DUF5367)
MISPRLALWALAYGLLIWFEATLIIRWMGDLIFIPEHKLWTIGGFVVTAALAFSIGWFFFATFQTTPGQRAASAIIICASGLIADALVFSWIDTAFPDMSGEQQRLFSVWVAWAYGVGLLSGLWPQKLTHVPQA